MQEKTLKRILLISVMLLGGEAYSQTQQYLKQEALYFEMCSSLNRSNVDCECVAKSHASYAHLSPSPEYANYLIESYKENIGQPNDMEKAFETYIGDRNAQEAQIEIYNAFDEYESNNPFLEEVNGCVIPNAPRVAISPLPSPPIFKTVYDYRVSSSGTERLEQCVLAETAKVLSEDELGALHYVYYRGVGANLIQQDLGISESEAKKRAKNASLKLRNYESNTRKIVNFCMALLAAEENSSGKVIARLARDEEQRKGPPLGLEDIDTSKPRPVLVDKLGMEQARIKADIEAIKAQRQAQPSAQELMSEIKASNEYKNAKEVQSAKATNADKTMIQRGCINAGNSDEFCDCFVNAFISKIGANKAAAALPVIADGISDSETMSLMRSIDQSTYMNDVMQAQNISVSCE